MIKEIRRKRFLHRKNLTSQDKREFATLKGYPGHLFDYSHTALAGIKVKRMGRVRKTLAFAHA